MAKQKFERTKPHVNIGTELENRIALLKVQSEKAKRFLNWPNNASR